MITFAPQFPATWLSETYAHYILTTFQDWPPNWQMLEKKITGTVFPYTDLPAGK